MNKQTCATYPCSFIFKKQTQNGWKCQNSTQVLESMCWNKSHIHLQLWVKTLYSVPEVPVSNTFLFQWMIIPDWPSCSKALDQCWPWGLDYGPLVVWCPVALKKICNLNVLTGWLTERVDTSYKSWKKLRAAVVDGARLCAITSINHPLLTPPLF